MTSDRGRLQCGWSCQAGEALRWAVGCVLVITTAGGGGGSAAGVGAGVDPKDGGGTPGAVTTAVGTGPGAMVSGG